MAEVVLAYDSRRKVRGQNLASLLGALGTTSTTALSSDIVLENFQPSTPSIRPSIPSIEEAPSINQIDNEPSWIDPLIEYLLNDSTSIDPKEARRISNKLYGMFF